MNKKSIFKGTQSNELKSNDNILNEDDVTIYNQKFKYKIITKNSDKHDVNPQCSVLNENSTMENESGYEKKKKIYRSEKVIEEMKKAAQLNAQVKVNVRFLDESQINSGLISCDDNTKNLPQDQMVKVDQMLPDLTISNQNEKNMLAIKNFFIPDSTKSDQILVRQLSHGNESSQGKSMSTNFHNSMLPGNKLDGSLSSFLNNNSRKELIDATCSRCESGIHINDIKHSTDEICEPPSTNLIPEPAKNCECKFVDNERHNKTDNDLEKKDFNSKSKKACKTSESYRQIIRKLKLHKSKKELNKVNSNVLKVVAEKNSVRKQMLPEMNANSKLIIKDVKSHNNKPIKPVDIVSHANWANTFKSSEIIPDHLSSFSHCPLKIKKKKSLPSYKSPEHSRSKDGGYDSDKTDICDYNDENNSKSEELCTTNSLNDLKKLNCLAALNLMPSQDTNVSKLGLQDVHGKLLNSYKSILTMNKWNIFDESLKVYGLNEYDQYCKNDNNEMTQIIETEALHKQKINASTDDKQAVHTANTRWLRQQKAYYKFYETDEIEQYQRYSMLKFKKMKAEKKLQGHDNNDKKCDKDVSKNGFHGDEESQAKHDDLTKSTTASDVIPNNNNESLDDDESEGNLVMDENLPETHLEPIYLDKQNITLAKKLKRKSDNIKDEKMKIKQKKKKNSKKNDVDDNETTSNEGNDDAQTFCNANCSKSENKSESFILSRELGPNFNWLENKIQKNYIADEMQCDTNQAEEKLSKMHKKKKSLFEHRSKHDKNESSGSSANTLTGDLNKNVNGKEETASNSVAFNNNDHFSGVNDLKEINNLDNVKFSKGFDKQGATLHYQGNTHDMQHVTTAYSNKFKQGGCQSSGNVSEAAETRCRQGNDIKNSIEETNSVASAQIIINNPSSAVKYTEIFDQIALKDYKKKLETYTKLKQMSEAKMQEIRNLEFEKEKVKIELWNLYNIQLRTSELGNKMEESHINKNENSTYSSYIPIPSPPLNIEIPNIKSAEHSSLVNMSLMGTDEVDDKDSSVKPYVICGPAMPLQKLLSFDTNHNQLLHYKQNLNNFSNSQTDSNSPQQSHSLQANVPKQNVYAKSQYPRPPISKNQLRNPSNNLEKQWKGITQAQLPQKILSNELQLDSTKQNPNSNNLEKHSINRMAQKSPDNCNVLSNASHWNGVTSGLFDNHLVLRQFSPQNHQQKLANVKGKLPEQLNWNQLNNNNQQPNRQFHQKIYPQQELRFTSSQSHFQQPQVLQCDVTDDRNIKTTNTANQQLSNPAVANDPFNMCYTVHNEFLEQTFNIPPRYNSPQILLHHLPSSRCNESFTHSPVKNSSSVDTLMKTTSNQSSNFQIASNKIEIDESEPIDVKPILDLSNKSSSTSTSSNADKINFIETTNNCLEIEKIVENDVSEAKVLDLSKERNLTPLNLKVNTNNNDNPTKLSLTNKTFDESLKQKVPENVSSTFLNSSIPFSDVTSSNHSVKPSASVSVPTVEVVKVKRHLTRPKSCEMIRFNTDQFLKRQISTQVTTLPSSTSASVCTPKPLLPTLSSPPPVKTSDDAVKKTVLSHADKPHIRSETQMTTNISAPSTADMPTACIYQTISSVVDADHNDLLDLCTKDPITPALSTTSAAPTNNQSIIKLFDSSAPPNSMELNKNISSKISNSLINNTSVSTVAATINSTSTKLTSKPIIDLTMDMKLPATFNKDKVDTPQTHVGHQLTNNQTSLKKFSSPTLINPVAVNIIPADVALSVAQQKSRNDSLNAMSEPKDRLQDFFSLKPMKHQNTSLQAVQQNPMLRLTSPQQLPQSSSSLSNPIFTELLQQQQLQQQQQQHQLSIAQYTQQPAQQYLQQQHPPHILQQQQFLHQQLVSSMPNVSINQPTLPYISLKQQQQLIMSQQKQLRKQHESPIVISPPPTFLDSATSSASSSATNSQNKKFQYTQKPHSLDFPQQPQQQQQQQHLQLQQHPQQQPQQAFPNVNYLQKPVPIRNNNNGSNMPNNMLNLLSDKRLQQQQHQQQQRVIPQILQPSQYLMAEQHLLQKQFLQQQLCSSQQPQQQLQRAQQQQQQQHICSNCFQSARFICSACRKVSYCSRECQADSWEKGHKNECKAI